MSISSLSDVIYTTTIDSPIGPLTLTAADGYLTGLHMAGAAHGVVHQDYWREDPSHFKAGKAQLSAYFKGTLTAFDLPMRPAGTDFQRRVWHALTEIPYGETISYAELARRVGNPKACRAVGLANGRNPIAVIVPCHRVIAADGTIGGYGGGLERKEWLLQMEVAARRRH